ncbi:MucB/RseB C-terminal domain-containing protein, partial [Pseudomonas brassicacearum]|uniref:MucB/RseB C-terminal domain-containing protein n=1 Tax=Pseudomonas brassicacearum TaxID=930166 RepID=UPI00161D43A7
KSLLLNDKGQLLERCQFTRLSIAEPSDGELQASADFKAVVQEQGKAASVKAAWHSDWLPPGFELTSSTARKDPDTKIEVNSLMYDDGLVGFSVFLEH